MDDLKIKSLVDRCKVLTDMSERGFVSMVDDSCANIDDKDCILEWFYLMKETVNKLYDEVR